jgi:hypothetical protein
MRSEQGGTDIRFHFENSLVQERSYIGRTINHIWKWLKKQTVIVLLKIAMKRKNVTLRVASAGLLSS